MATNIIKINRGDTKDVILYLENELNTFFECNYPVENEELFKKDDQFFFYITYPFQKPEEAIFCKNLTRDSIDPYSKCIIFTLDSSDTIKFNPGVYYYGLKFFTFREEPNPKNPAESIKVQEIYTIVDRTKFIVYD